MSVGGDVREETVDGIIGGMLVGETKLVRESDVEVCHVGVEGREDQFFKDSHNDGGDGNGTIVRGVGEVAFILVDGDNVGTEA